EQARSGLSIRAWCREHDLHEHAFYWWRVRLARAGRKVRSRRPASIATRPGQAFVPVRVSAQEVGGTDGQIEMALSGYRRVRVSGPVNREALAEVLAVLEARPC